jgi:ADP-heptose:LPS heptosyltransferase
MKRIKNRMPELPRKPERVLVIRTDRMGDVILSLPVLTALKESFPGVHVAMLLRPYTAGLVEGYPDVDEILLFEEPKNWKSLWRIRQWARWLQRHHFDTVLCLHPKPLLALMCYLAQIPHRVGTGYRAYSFLFNQKIYHHRKSGARHELEFNLDLSEKIGATLKKVTFKIPIPPPAHAAAERFLNENKISNQEKWVILHPGSGGSAKDWPLEKFVALSDRLQSEAGVKTIFTGGPDDAELLQQVMAHARFKPALWFGKSGLKELAALIRRASLFIANSTGPLHLAVALETRVIGFYCPIIPCLPRRWGPYGHLDSVLSPPVESCKKCTGKDCRHFNCMDLISVDAAFKMALKKLV